jgi:hypothetical protein
VSTRREHALDELITVNGVVPPDPHRPLPKDTVLDSNICVMSSHISCLIDPSLSFDINKTIETEILNIQHLVQDQAIESFLILSVPDEVKIHGDKTSIFV